MWIKRSNRDCENNLPMFPLLLANNQRIIKENRMGNEFNKTVMNEGAEGLIYAQQLKETYPWIKLVPWILILLMLAGCMALMS